MIPTMKPTGDLPPMILFEDCKKGETSAKTGCTPASGGGGKQESTPIPEGAGVKDVAALIAEDLNINLNVSFRKGEDAFVLEKIVVKEEERGKGSGTEAMKRLMDWADKSGQTVALTPDPVHGGNKKRLIEFYKRFGFKPNKGKNKDFRFQETMIREPQ
jgi:GNAT superfamily N-acetyltransferase